MGITINASASINLLGKCNARCFFCLGQDIPELLKRHNQTHLHFREWKNFESFLGKCRANNIQKLYVTGPNTDSLLYDHLDELVDYLHQQHFMVGLRTNGYAALEHLNTINKCELSTGYSIHTLQPTANKMIMGRDDLPDWEKIIPATQRPRMTIVLNRYNKNELWSLLRYLSKFQNIRYIQVRRVVTDIRVEELAPDMAAYEDIYSEASKRFPFKEILSATNGEVYDIYGRDVIFWRTIKIGTGSMNYFTDGTISDLQLVVEGYQKYHQE